MKDFSIADLDALFVIADNALLLDKAEADLRGNGHVKLAGALFKLQQDAGLEIDNEMTGSFSEPPAGPASAALRAAYEPVTPARYALLLDVQQAVSDAGLKSDIASLSAKLPKAAATTASPAHKAQP